MFLQDKSRAHPQRTLVKCFDLPLLLNSSLPDCSEWLACLVEVRVRLHSPASTTTCAIFFLPLAKGSSLVLGAGHLEGLRLFGAKLQVGSILRAPGQSSWGGRAGRWEVLHCPLWAVVVRAGSCLALG